MTSFKLRVKYFIKWFFRRIDEEILLPILTWFWKLLSRRVAPERHKKKMVHADWKTEALEDFRQWLAEIPDTFPPSESATPDSCDLFTLLSEFSALRQEIRLQNRQVTKSKSTMDEAVSILQDSAQLFKTKSHQLDLLHEKIRVSCEKKTVANFFDVRDALVRGKAAVNKIVKNKTFLRPLPKGMDGALEGYEMAIRRMDKALLALNVQPIETVGRPFDPKTMKAIDKKADTGVDTGIVIQEVSGGFIRGDEILKTAHVIVAQ